MKTKQTFVNLQEIKLPVPNIWNSKISLKKLAIQYRQKKIQQLKLRGYKDEEISEKIGFSISTIEKDLHEIREKSRSWYDSEAIKDFCLSLYDSIVLCDNAIADLQILYQECVDVNSKLEIMTKILEFEQRKTSSYQKIKSVQDYLGNLK